MNTLYPCRFPLRSDFHQEVGWQAYVRDQTTSNPQVIRSIMEKRIQFVFGPDPLSLLERWEPFTMGCMFYFWMVRRGQAAASFVATDSLFTMYFNPLPRNQHLVGLPEELLELAHEAVAAGGDSTDPSPLMPAQQDDGPAQADILPGQIVVHQYHDGIAYLRPCLPALKALAIDANAWLTWEPKAKTYTFHPVKSRDPADRRGPAQGAGSPAK